MSKENTIEFYTGKLAIKERRIQEYIEEKNSDDGFRSFVREKDYYVLKAEIELIQRFLDDLHNL